MFPIGKRVVQLILLISAAFTASSAFATTYYVDYSSGSDSNGGTSKSSPWQHAPGMGGCSANCASANPGPGDSIILKGGVTWPMNTLGTWTPQFQGTSSKYIYVGVDQSWYNGSSWSRPILNGNQVNIGGNNVFFNYGLCCITVDNLEFTGAFWNDGTFGHSEYVNINTASNVTFTNNYFHGWVNPSGSVDYGRGWSGSSQTGGNANALFQYNVVDGSDTAEVQADPNCTGACLASLDASYTGPSIIRNNVFRYLSNGYVGSAQEFSGNLVEYIRNSTDPTNHENGFENNSDPCSGLLFFNNVIRHVKAGVTIWMAPQAGCSPSYAWNNVVYDTTSGNVWDVAAALSNPYGTQYFFNNTVECGPDGSVGGVCTGCLNQMVSCMFTNNHFITSGGPAALIVSPTTTSSGNIFQTQSVANSQGYSASETFAFSPPSTSAATVGKGVSLSGSSLASLIASVLPSASMSTDTTYGCTYNQSSHSVSCPGRTTMSRSGGWDVGAYQFGSASASQPQAPTGLAATVN